MARLPVPGGDSGDWGTVLNDFLDVEHNTDGTHNIAGVEKTANKGAANGYAPLNSSTQVPISYLPTIPQSQVTGLTTSLDGKVNEGALTFNVMDYGAKGDAVRVRTVTANSASTSVTAGGASFTSADVGKAAVVYTEDGAGTFTTIAAVNSGTQITLSVAAGITASGSGAYLLYGTNDSAAITAAFTAATLTGTDATVGPNQPIGLGMARVLLPAQANEGGYITTSQLTVPSGVNLDGPGMIVNMLSDRYQPVLILSPYAMSNTVQIECLFGTGVQAGTSTTDQAHIRLGNVRLWHVGVATESGGLGRSQDGLVLEGYHFEVNGFFCKGGVRAIYHNQGSDATINYAYAIGSLTGVSINGANQVSYAKLLLDTCGATGGGSDGVMINNFASNISMNIQAFEVTGTTHTLDNVVRIGSASTNVNKDINLSVQANNTGGAILNMAYTQEAAISLLGSNSQFPSGANLPITTAVVYGAGNTGINSISAMLETSITPSTGTQQGTFSYNQLDATTFANPVTVAGQVTATNTPSTDIYNGNAIATGEEILPRLNVNSAQPLNASGTLHLIYFTARKTETINNIRMSTDATAATGTTLARMGIYSVNAGTGDLTLVAACANDAALFGGTYTPYQRALTAAFNKVKGTRYAVGVLVVGTGMPAITATTCAGADAALAPRLCGIVTGQADLPANVTGGTVADDYRLFQCMITP
jgi:hypothetical protein